MSFGEKNNLEGFDFGEVTTNTKKPHCCIGRLSVLYNAVWTDFRLTYTAYTATVSVITDTLCFEMGTNTKCSDFVDHLDGVTTGTDFSYDVILTNVGTGTGTTADPVKNEIRWHTVLGKCSKPGTEQRLVKTYQTTGIVPGNPNAPDEPGFAMSDLRDQLIGKYGAGGTVEKPEYPKCS